MKKQKVWFVTGASKGFGLSLVKQLLQQGHQVAATSRNVNALYTAIGRNDADFLPLRVDLTNEEEVGQAIEQTVGHFGSIDVVVNNAGYGLTGSLEELSDQEARQNFEVNVFGTLHVIRKVMPYLRQRQSGHIFNISSIGGFFGSFPGWGIYCATKFAVEGLSESLAEEVKAFGVKVTIVAPGYFRTDFLSSGSLTLPQHPIEAYKEVRESQDMHQNSLNGNQSGDPEKAVAAIIRIASEQNPPLHLFLGEDAYQMAYDKMKAVESDLESWREVTLSTAL
ncbi:oxidoreductase [Catalinimonas niigatensis]|uniref:oxidoreductase n=1 Tax=Catalinimonas niigatensis TaxID=1397264 RepID=UPI0026659B23|nr:oxidoreductase [Catalinimonas niigatensis]WPP53041.1 oxidoreductase [Catalinimonas niigatensis]